MVKAFFRALLLACFFITTPEIYAKAGPGPCTETLIVNSKALSEKREVWVHLPASYLTPGAARQRYLVVYLLDAEINFGYYSGLADFMARGGMGNVPEMIVVGITNTDRTRDFTPTKSFTQSPVKPGQRLFENSGGAEKFNTFLTQELREEIDHKYRTLPYRGLVGHSFGGLFTINSLLKHPGDFNFYVANDASFWWDNGYLLKTLEEVLKAGKHAPAGTGLFMTEAGQRNEGEGLGAGVADSRPGFKNAIGSYLIDWTSKRYESESHGTVSYIGNRDALAYIFNGYGLSPRGGRKSEQDLKKALSVFSAKRGFTFEPTPAQLTTVSQSSGKQASQ